LIWTRTAKKMKKLRGAHRHTDSPMSIGDKGEWTHTQQGDLVKLTSWWGYTDGYTDRQVIS
jgi:hypothetical protein